MAASKMNRCFEILDLLGIDAVLMRSSLSHPHNRRKLARRRGTSQADRVEQHSWIVAPPVPSAAPPPRPFFHRLHQLLHLAKGNAQLVLGGEVKVPHACLAPRLGQDRLGPLSQAMQPHLDCRWGHSDVYWRSNVVRALVLQEHVIHDPVWRRPSQCALRTLALALRHMLAPMMLPIAMKIRGEHDGVPHFDLHQVGQGLHQWHEWQPGVTMDTPVGQDAAH
eukprot:4557280-Lingulodinium_polyedra.AAC.1